MGNERVVRLACACLMLVWLGACGDDDGESSTPDAGSRAGSGGSAGSSSNPLDSGMNTVRLPDDTAGKACTNTTDCGGGMCATQISGTGILPMALPAPDGYCTANCMTNADCGAGGVCILDVNANLGSRCYASCSGDDDCRDGYICGGVMIPGAGGFVPNSCRPAPATDQLEDGVVGDACSAVDDCPGGQCLTMRGIMGFGGFALPAGYCSGDCLEDAHCGAGGVCVQPPLVGGAGSCYLGCDSDDDCERDGYRCREIETGVRGCNPFADPLPDNRAGAACSGDADCGGGAETCVTELPAAGFGADPLPAPGGYCSLSCVENSDCGAGGVCIRSFFGGTCFKRCTGAGDCRDGYACEARNSLGMMNAPADAGASGTMVCSPTPSTEADAG